MQPAISNDTLSGAAQRSRTGKAAATRAVLLGVALLGLLTILGIIRFDLGYGRNFVHLDGIGYYAYLPATFIDRDLTFETLSENSFSGTIPIWTGIQRYEPNGLYFNKYPIGVAVLLLPFFALAHGLSLIAGLPSDGYSTVYQYMAALGGLAYTICGLALLVKLLRRQFSERVALLTIICITFGTNLFNYATYDSTMSHAFSFFLVTALLAMIPRWYERPTLARSALLGLIAGLIVLTRNTNALFLFCFPLYGVLRPEDGRQRIKLLWGHRLQLATLAGVGALVLLPQLYYWHSITGHWIVKSYQGEGFDFLAPQLLNVLFSTQKGLFFWSPLLLLASAGFWPMRRLAPAYLLSGLLALALFTYLIASWHEWQFGWSYGHRAFIDGLSIFALGLASLLASLRGKAALAAALFCGACVLLSVVQMIQYWMQIIPPQHTTWEVYWSVFLRFS
jgi:hypothetical protein